MAEGRARAQRTTERRDRILAAARERADAHGWAAVTTRHLASAIGYTQPVLYGHFPGGKPEIMLAVALDGFAQLARECRAAMGTRHGRSAIEAVSRAYLDFGRAHPAVYEAMFNESIAVAFATDEAGADVIAGFAVLREAIGDQGDGTVTETFWAALHGLGQLERAGRIRLEHRDDRIRELGGRFSRENAG